jgi:integrase
MSNFPELLAHFRQHIHTYQGYAQANRLLRRWVDTLDQAPDRLACYHRHQSQWAAPIQANKELMLLRAMFNWGTRLGLWTGENPARQITLYPAYQREVVMTRHELVRLRDSLPECSVKYRAYFGQLLFTGCRMSEARMMRWEDLLPGRRWHKPTTKNGRPHVVPIPLVAWEWIQDVPRMGEFVYRGLYGHCLSRPAAEKAWMAHRQALGLSHIWLHDFRRTMMSYLYTELKADELTIKALLNHYDSRPIAIYTRLNLEFLAEVLERYSQWVGAL